MIEIYRNFYSRKREQTFYIRDNSRNNEPLSPSFKSNSILSPLSLSLSEVNKGPVKMNLVRLINRNWIVKDPIFCRENEISVVNEMRSPRRTRSSSRLEYRAFAYRLSGYSWGQCTRCRGEGLRLDVGKHNDPANVSLL